MIETNELVVETLDEKLDRIIKQEYGNRFWENGKIVFGGNQNQVSKSTTEVSKTSEKHHLSPSHKISDNRCKHSNKDSWKCTTNFVKIVCYIISFTKTPSYTHW